MALARRNRMFIITTSLGEFEQSGKTGKEARELYWKFRKSEDEKIIKVKLKRAHKQLRLFEN